MSIFSFRKFKVWDDRAIMKVGTDAVLLGAWTDVGESKNILDIGTGSGVIALMMAQRSANDAVIDAIELMDADAQQATENVAQSPWPKKISVINQRVQEFHPDKQYDLIVCNPPFFSNSLLPPKKSRSTVRHTTSLTWDELIEVTLRLLSSNGKLSIILPFSESEVFIQKATAKELFICRLTKFFTREGKPQERSLLEFRFNKIFIKTDSMTLYESENKWTQPYRILTQEFYLDQQG